MSALQALTSHVRNASHPILLQEALDGFNTTAPFLDAFLKKGALHCAKFKERFPETSLLNGPKFGLLQAVWGAVGGLFTDIASSLEPHEKAPPTDEALFASLLDQGREELQSIHDRLNDLEDLLSAPNRALLEDISGSIRQIREERFFLESCSPKMTQGIEAVKNWVESIESQSQAATNLVAKFHEATSQTVKSKENAAAAAPLIAMCETALPTPMSEEIFASLVEPEIGNHTEISAPSQQTFTEVLHTLLKAGSKNKNLLQATEDVLKFESFLDPFRLQLSRYPLQRFVKNGAEYQEVLDPIASRFSKELSLRLDELDQKKRDFLFIPFTQSVFLNFENQDLEALFRRAGKGQLTTKSHSLLQIEKSGNSYNIRFYESASPRNTPYVLFKKVSRSHLLNSEFIKDLLKHSSHVAEVKKLDPFIEIMSKNWAENSQRFNYCSDFVCEIFQSIDRFIHAFGLTVRERVKDFKDSIQAIVGLDGKKEKLFDFLKEHFGSPSEPASPPRSSKKSQDNPSAIWEALFLEQKETELLFDLKLSSLSHLSRLSKTTDEETEIVLNLAKTGVLELSRALGAPSTTSQNLPFGLSRGKLLYVDSMLQEIKSHLAERERDLHRARASKIEPVSTAPIFGSLDKTVTITEVAPAANDLPSKVRSMKVLGEGLAQWIPSHNNLHPLHDFAKELAHSYEQEQYDAIIVSIRSLFETFNFASLDNLFWENLKETDAENLLFSLKTIAQFYFKSYFDANVARFPDPESGLIMIETMALADRIMKKLPKNHHLSSERMALKEFFPYLFNRGIFFRFGDPRLDLRLEALQSYSEREIDQLSSPLFSTNLAPLRQSFLGFAIGNMMTSPRIELNGQSNFTDRFTGDFMIERAHLNEEDRLESYLRKFVDPYNLKRPKTSLPDKLANMWTGSVSDVLPQAFYALREIDYYVRYFFRGVFTKPPGFVKSPTSYTPSFYEISMLEETSAVGVGTLLKYLLPIKTSYLLARLEGFDDGAIDAIRSTNPEIPDGIRSAHQFYYNSRPLVDPVIREIFAPYRTIHGDPFGDLFFGSFYKKFTSFAPGITEHGRNLHDLNVVMVQPTENLKKYLTEREYIRLASLKTEPAVQIANTLSFFREKSHLLRTPDMQSYFIHLLFDPPLLMNELLLSGRGPELERQLAEFAGGEYSLNLQLGELETAHFYLSLIARLRQYSLIARKMIRPSIYSVPQPEVFSDFPQTLHLAIERSSEESKGMLHGLAAQEWLTKDSIGNGKEFLRHVILYHRFPPSGKMEDPLLSLDIKRLMGRFAPEIAKLSKTNPFFEEIAKEAYPALPKDAVYVSSLENPFIYSVKGHPITIDLKEGTILAPGLKGASLPADGLNSPVYTAMYGAREFRCTPIDLNTFEFTDHLGKLNRLIRQPDESFVLQRKFPDRGRGWYQYIPQDLLIEKKDKRQLSDSEKELKNWIESWMRPEESGHLPILPSMPLIDGYTHWYTEDVPGEMLIIDRQGRASYRAEISGSEILRNAESPKKLHNLYSLKPDGTDHLELVSLPHPALSWIEQFEDPSQTLIWKNPTTQEVERIEFPRFGSDGLSFTKEGTLLKSDQFAGYFLKVKQINPLGDQCPNFLILQNHRGDEKLLLAGQGIIPSSSSSLSSRLTFQRDPKALGKRIPFFAYDRLNGNQLFRSPDISANFYLAMIHGAKKRYKEAIALLREFGQGSNPFTQTEKETLQSVAGLGSKVRDDAPLFKALIALAHLTLKRNEKEHQNPADSLNQSGPSKPAGLIGEALNALDTGLGRKQNPADAYFKVASGLSLFRLTLEEELFLLQESKYQGKESPEIDAIRKLIQHHPEKAKDEILSLAAGDFSMEKANQILQESAALISKTEPLSSLSLEPILKNPFEFVEKRGASQSAIETSLRSLFDTTGLSSIQKRGFDFYLKDSLLYLQNKDQSQYTLKDLQALRAKRIELDQTHQFMKESLGQVEHAILRLAAKPPSDPVEQAQFRARLSGNTAAFLSFNELLLLYMQNDLNTLRLKNPELNQADIDKLDQMIDLYLDLAIQNSQRKRVASRMLDVEQLGHLKEEDPTFKLALQSFVAESMVKRHYDPKHNRFLKVFEFHNGFYYRENQIDKLQKLGVELDHGSSHRVMESLVLEMMVGAGKTTYLLPTKGFWSADGKKLSMAIMPEALIGNMSREVERILGKTFAMRVKRFEFSRNTNLNPSNLQALYQMLEDAIVKKEYLIATDKSLKALLNQYASVLHEALRNQQPEMVEKAEWMRKILKLFKEKAEVLCDEADLILDPRRELNFPTGEPSSLPQNYLSLTLKIYELLTSPDILRLASFEFFPSAAPPCTPNIFKQKVKPALVDQIVQFLSKQDPKEPFHDLRTFYAKLPDDKKEQLKQYLLGTDSDSKREGWIRSLNEEIREQLGLIHGQLNVLLPLTLEKNYGERYGFHSEESIIADPFSSSNSPNIGSQFSDPFERADFTIQAYLKEKGMRRPIIERLVHDLQTRHMEEMRENLDQIKKLPPSETYRTKALEEFQTYFGNRKNLHLFHPKLVDLLMEIMQTEPQAKFKLIDRYVLPQIKVYPENLKATSQSIAFLFNHLKGFTGTLWNTRTYHDKIKAQFDDGARGQVVTLAFTQAKDKVATVKIQDRFQLHRELIIGQPRYSHIKALIDAGGALKEHDLQTVAKEWLDHLVQQASPIQGVVFFDKNDQPLIWEVGESRPIPLTKSALPPEKRITIYDQKHTTGTDIKQAIDAVALVTVSKGMIMRDFIQAVGRMRQLASGQKIEIAILEPDAIAIRELLGLDPQEKLAIEHVIRFLVKNEVIRQGDDNQVATTHKLTAVIQEWILTKLLGSDDIQTIAKKLSKGTIDLLQKLFVQNSEISPFFNYGQGTEWIDAQTAYQKKIDHLIGRFDLKSAVEQDPFLNPAGQAVRELNRLMQEVVQKAELPPVVSASLYTGGKEEQQEQQAQQQVEVEQQQEQQQQQDQAKPKGQKPWSHAPWAELIGNPHGVLQREVYEPASNSNLKESRLHSYFLKANEVMPRNSQILDEKLLLSRNFQLNRAQHFGAPVKPFGQFQKPVTNVLIIRNLQSKSFQLHLIEPYDAAVFKGALQETDGSLPISKDPDLSGVYSQDYFSKTNDWECLDPLKDIGGGSKSRYREWGWEFQRNDNLMSRPISDCPIIRIPWRDRVSESNKNPAVQVWIGDLHGQSLYESNPPIPKEVLASDSEIAKLLVQAAYFNGEIHYPGKKREILKNWLLQAINPQSYWTSRPLSTIDDLENDFTKTIIQFNEQAKRDYPKSALCQVFKELRSEV